MGKIVERKRRKKKKGRPSLLDLQKRSLKQEQGQGQQKQNLNPYANSNFRNPIIPNPNPNPNRRFTRRNPVSDIVLATSEKIDVGDDNDDDDYDSNGKRREKKFKFVLRLPSHRQQRSLANSTSLNSASSGSDSNVEDGHGETPLKKRKINAVGDGSDYGDGQKGRYPKTGSNATDMLPETPLESGPATSLPNKKLLEFILDRLQKKDSYGVFSEPVDAEELPDYHEVIEHPMDFGTVRKKLAAGAYVNLEQFEKDVFLISSNAMQYNAPDTIYFRQARSIHELAKKNFENLRHDSDDNEPEPKVVVRRGRPPTKNLKKPLGRPPLDRAAYTFSDATLATVADKIIWSNSYDLRKAHLLDNSAPSYVMGKTFHGSYNNSKAYERNDEFPVSMFKGTPLKYGKKHPVLDENRRNTYNQSYLSVGGREASIFTTCGGAKQQLVAVGLHSEYGYSRSIARFAANLGPVAWKVASEKIKRALPAGVKFGPGWVGENDAPPPESPLLSSPPPSQADSLPKTSLTTASSPPGEESKEKSTEKHDSLDNLASDDLPSRHLLPSTASSSSTSTNRYQEPTTTATTTIRGINHESGFSCVGPRPPFQIHQGPIIHPSLNGFGFNHAFQMGKFVRPEGSIISKRPHTINTIHQMPTNYLGSEDLSSNSVISSNSLQDSSHEALAVSVGTHLHQKPDSVPPDGPDLNARFRSPGSPRSNVRVDSP